MRERELTEAAAALGVSRVSLLDYEDQQLDRAEPAEAIAAIAGHIRHVRPHVLLTFPPDGAYGHPDHIAVSQFATAASVAATDPRFSAGDAPPHTVAKLYFLAWSQAMWAAYQRAFKTLVSTVDGVERRATPWPDWALTTVVDTQESGPAVWRAVGCHASQIAAYAALEALAPAERDALWGSSSFYRVYSLVNGGRRRESDLFEGLR